MGIEHENADCGAEMDQFVETLNQFDYIQTNTINGIGLYGIEYINGEGDSPFIKYRLTLEAIEVVSAEDYAKLKAE